ncbi:NrdH-redoxin [Tersicoccus solisilvae]|uniref:NrdH-redoxin n=1 Tax=Tersicoccus solisilvae TaxID=1882339 RepID=A0ABQ1NSN4_9MICC|nr:mycoredoxin [Tersicoccus solisilvae]GGC84025.1 NrdH-redoxin [Tersicoccus solisilvae]
MAQTADITEYTPAAGSITMFSTSWCGYCRRLKSQLSADGIGFTEVNIEETPGTADLVEAINNGNQTVPTVIFPDGTNATNPSAKEVKARLGL